MTRCVVLLSPSPLFPLPSRERGILSVDVVLLASPIPALWIPACAGMTGWYAGNDGEGCCKDGRDLDANDGERHRNDGKGMFVVRVGWFCKRVV